MLISLLVRLAISESITFLVAVEIKFTEILIVFMTKPNSMYEIY